MYLCTPPQTPFSHDLIYFPFITANVYPGFLARRLAALLPVISYIFFLSLPLSVASVWSEYLGDWIIFCACFYTLECVLCLRLNHHLFPFFRELFDHSLACVHADVVFVIFLSLCVRTRHHSVYIS